MRKPLIIIILILVVAVAGWFGYREMRENNLLAADEPVLLVNEAEGIYTTTDHLSGEQITSEYEAIDYINALTAEEIDEITEGMRFLNTLEVSTPTQTIEQPTQEQQAGWQEALNRLSQDQRDLCDDIDGVADTQQCIMRHYIFVLLSQGADADACGPVYVDLYREECRKTVSGEVEHTLTDQGNNDLIDLYEVQAGTFSGEADTSFNFGS